MNINRNTSDGELIRFRQDDTVEGTISVSGTTVSYNGGHLSRWAQTTTAKDDSLVKGTVLSNLDAMNVYTDADGNPVYQGIGTGPLDGHFAACVNELQTIIQELKAIVDAQGAEIAALKGATA